MSRHSMAVAVAAAGLLFASAASAAAGPPAGVYSCYDPQMQFSPVSGFHLVITPTPVAMFGIIDGSTYSDYDGHHGHYTYDSAGGILAMTDGSRQGWRYRRTANWSFTLISNKDGKEWYTCPLERGKNPAHGPW